MKDLISERLILLATAQESMMDVSEMMSQWDSSQLLTEKNAFDSMNVSDAVLNMSKEGERLVGLLEECCSEIAVGASAEKYLKMTALLEEIWNLFHSITEASAKVNDISHKIEGEVAYQKEIEENIKNHLNSVGESLNSALACAEMMMAEL